MEPGVSESKGRSQDSNQLVAKALLSRTSHLHKTLLKGQLMNSLLKAYSTSFNSIPRNLIEIIFST